MGKKIFFIDATKCVACYACHIACKDEFVDHSWLPYSEAQPDHGPSFISINEVERGQFPKVKICYVPQPCMQCENAQCLKVAKDGAVYKREDGIIIIDPIKSKGQNQILRACPYNCIILNEELGIPQKCTLCVHLLEQGNKEPRCVEVCPTRALMYDDVDKFEDLVKDAEKLHPRYKTNPSVFYLGIPKTFVAGSIYCSETGDCLEGVDVYLTDKANMVSIHTSTNNYGDFEFEDIEKGPIFLLKIEADGYYSVNIDNIMVDKDIYLKEIYLQKVM